MIHARFTNNFIFNPVTSVASFLSLSLLDELFCLFFSLVAKKFFLTSLVLSFPPSRQIVCSPSTVVRCLYVHYIREISYSYFLKLNVLVASSASDSGGVLVFTFKCAYIHVTFLAVPAEGRVVF